MSTIHCLVTNTNQIILNEWREAAPIFMAKELTIDIETYSNVKLNKSGEELTLDIGRNYLNPT